MSKSQRSELAPWGCSPFHVKHRALIGRCRALLGPLLLSVFKRSPLCMGHAEEAQQAFPRLPASYWDRTQTAPYPPEEGYPRSP